MMARKIQTAKRDSESVAAKVFFAAAKQEGDATISIGRLELLLTNLDKVYWPDERYTKFDLLKYYYSISNTILPYLKDRPLILKRYPDGIKGQMFYQHNLEKAPAFVEIFAKREASGKMVHNPVANNLAALLYLVNLGAIAQNPWFSRVQSISKPDYFAFDLDPGDRATFEQVKAVALEVKKVLGEFGLTGYPKTSGSSGIHIYVPVKADHTYKQIFPLAKQIAQLVAEQNPGLATIRRSLAGRKATEVYIDYMQNMEGKSLAAAYSVREKAGAPVSAPVAWNEITKKLTIEQFTMKNMPTRLKKKSDLFAEVLTQKQSVTAALKTLL